MTRDLIRAGQLLKIDVASTTSSSDGRPRSGPKIMSRYESWDIFIRDVVVAHAGFLFSITGECDVLCQQ